MFPQEAPMAQIRTLAAKAKPNWWQNGYPTTDHKPMAETDTHRDLMLELIETLKHHFAAQPKVYVSGNLLLFYEKGNKRRHVSPDVFVVRGVPMRQRPNYLLWEEGKAPQVVIELTSKTTKREDLGKKFTLYQNILKVKEYFLFDPLGDYLKPAMQGHRLRAGIYRPIAFVNNRLPSLKLGLELERDGKDLRLYNPAASAWLPTPTERAANADERAANADKRAANADERAANADERAANAELENHRLRQELESIKARIKEGGPKNGAVPLPPS
jgi:Uma2 family endonuclease